MQINKKTITFIAENAKLMLGVNKGFHDSPLPGWAIENYSKLDDLKPELRNDDKAITQDLLLRLGSQATTKATVGAATFGALEHIRDQVDPSSNIAWSVIPAIGTAWGTSAYSQKYLPSIHKAIFKNNSIYK